MWAVGPVGAGCVTFGKSLPLSGPQHPLPNAEGRLSEFSPPRLFHKV